MSKATVSGESGTADIYMRFGGPGDASKIRAAQVQLLYESSFTAAINGVCGAIAVILLWHSFPPGLLIAWLGVTAGIIALRFVLRHLYRRAGQSRSNSGRWALLFCFGALSSGALWGALALSLPLFGTPRDYLVVALVIGGMTAGALISHASYLPALFSFAFPAVAPVAVAFSASADHEFAATGLLVVVYLGAVLVMGRNANRTIRHTLELRIANDALHASLQHAHTELDVVQQEKWSTLAHLSHELRTPLNAIIGFSEAMRAQIFGPLGHPKYREYAAYVHSSGQYLLNLANEILDVTQGELGALVLSEADIDVSAAVESCAQLVLPRAEAQKLRLTWQVTSDLPRLRADDTKLCQILLNLLSNAVKFTPQGGEVSLTASLTTEGGIAFAVTDTGIGISEADISRVTEPFVRLANPLVQESVGAGLGLPICKKLAEIHGGALTITSAPGMGTICRVLFPPSRTVHTAAPPPSTVMPIAS